jgi:hypothetical protein
MKEGLKQYREALRSAFRHADAASRAAEEAFRASLRNDSEGLEKAENTIEAESAACERESDRAAALRADLVALGALPPTELPV